MCTANRFLKIMFWRKLQESKILSINVCSDEACAIELVYFNIIAKDDKEVAMKCDI